MFKKLRNRFILINMAITTVILVVSLGIIYGVASASLRNPVEFQRMSIRLRGEPEIVDIVRQEIRNDREKNLSNLMMALIFVACSVEILVFCVSYKMAERSIAPIKEAYQKQREFIANASHELKTPIAAIQANFEALGVDDEPWTGNIETELNHANRLVKDLLLLARTDGREQKIRAKKCDLVKVVRKEMQIFEARLGGKKIVLDLPKKHEIMTVESDVVQILDILLDNAVKYSKKKIKVELNIHGLTVSNDGKTIPAEKLKHIFERFYQVDKSTNGAGLGLAIAKAVADQNAWKISASSSKNWTSFSLIF